MSRKILPFGDAQVRLGGIGRTKVYDLIDAGVLTKVNIGSRAFITEESIDAYLESLTAKENV